MAISILKILECSRIFSLPMTIMSWLVVFTYSVTCAGNVFYGILCLLGICFAHLGTNLIDDYFDYKYLIKRLDFNKDEYLAHSQKTKCRYIIEGIITDSQLLILALLFFLMAAIIGFLLFIKCGKGVLYFAAFGGVFAFLYPLLSRICLSELAIAITFGPALFGGVYYVMTGNYSIDVLILSLPTMIMTIVLLYIHMVMDYEFDKNEGKKTLANAFLTPEKSLVLLKAFLITAYLSLILTCVFDILDWQVFFVFLTLPLAFDLFKSLLEFTKNPESVPNKKWYHVPMENLKELKAKNEASFMIRMYQARNLMVYFSLIYILAIIVSLTT